VNSDATSLVVSSQDTDVAVFILEHFDKMKCKKVWMKTGTAKHRQYIPGVHNIAKRPDMKKAKLQNLIGFHAITGSDSTSFLSGQSKVSWWKVFQQHHQLLANLGKGQLTDDTSKKAELFVCKLYISNCETADGARTIMFRKATAPENLPPSSDALSFHIKRAHYQASVWQQAHEKPNLPPIESMGWQQGWRLPLRPENPSIYFRRMPRHDLLHLPEAVQL
jgi:hypothetical protein